MKRLVIAIVLLIIVFAGCVFNYFYLKNSVSQLVSYIYEADTMAEKGDIATAEKLVNDSFNLWKKKQNPIGATMRHHEMDDIHNLYVRAIQHAKNGNIDDYLVQSKELERMLEHLLEIETVNIKNVL